ncbi:hypothetical protein MKK63_11000 [Methylobacterium sp. J-088]|uniref:hypothetical protein n=1 Tax=Methylobacterium sp. J-088 TaxID=2836664 RepID=UPI001FB96837|nr:hypothetical protein [Methylobacterium sp. J-088]MCJ2063237.1 hypothetical protein [Methylobacterium sp. J-088]
MTVSSLYPPIAAATIINVALFALAWRGHQAEARSGKAPWWLGFGAAAYAAFGALLVYLRRGQPIASSADLFGAAMVGEAMGALITYGLVYSFVLSKGRPWADRAIPMVASLFFVVIAVAAVFTV